jgi:hypothetical protein
MRCTNFLELHLYFFSDLPQNYIYHRERKYQFSNILRMSSHCISYKFVGRQ